MSQFFTSGGQSIGASASASVLPINRQGWFPLGLTGLISLQAKGLSRVFSSTTVWNYQFLGTQPSLPFNSHICTWLLEKNVTLTRNPRRQHCSALNHPGPGSWDHSYGLKPPKLFKLAYPKHFTCPASPFTRSSGKGSGLNLPLAPVFLITLASSPAGPMWDAVPPVSRIPESNKLCFSQPLFLSLLVATHVYPSHKTKHIQSILCFL